MRRPATRLARLGIALVLPLVMATATAPGVPAADLPPPEPSARGAAIAPPVPVNPPPIAWIALGAGVLGLVAAAAGFISRRRARRDAGPAGDDLAAREAGGLPPEDLEARLGEALAHGRATSTDRPNPRSRAAADAPIWVRRLDAEIPILATHGGGPPPDRSGAGAHHESEADPAG